MVKLFWIFTACHMVMDAVVKLLVDLVIYLFILVKGLNLFDDARFFFWGFFLIFK